MSLQTKDWVVKVCSVEECFAWVKISVFNIIIRTRVDFECVSFIIMINLPEKHGKSVGIG